MDLLTLVAMYPIAKDLLEKSPQLRKWMEKKAKKEDPSFILQLQMIQALTDLRRYTLRTSIMGAMLSNPKLQFEDIKRKFIESGEVAESIIQTLEKVSP